jgi:NAD(P)-dependent dehydrogenase (short-subunit alcohol dehydrogenase family)
MTEQVLRFDDRVALVTGAGSGLGRSYALLLAARGARVVVNDLDRQEDGRTPAERTCAEIRETGGEAVPHNEAVDAPGAGERMVQTALDTWGRLDVLVNNAGITRDRSFAKMSDGEFLSVLGVHLGGTIAATRAAWAPMRKHGYGRVVLTTSVAGLFGNFGQANYASAKAAFLGLGRTLAIEGARSGILVNLLSPGAATAMTESILPEDMRATMSPDLVAPMVAYLCHESCAVSGEIFVARQGHFARNLVVETAGYDTAEPTPEDVAANLDRIMSTDSWTIPESAIPASATTSARG